MSCIRCLMCMFTCLWICIYSILFKICVDKIIISKMGVNWRSYLQVVPAPLLIALSKQNPRQVRKRQRKRHLSTTLWALTRKSNTEGHQRAYTRHAHHQDVHLCVYTFCMHLHQQRDPGTHTCNTTHTPAHTKEGTHMRLFTHTPFECKEWERNNIANWS